MLPPGADPNGVQATYENGGDLSGPSHMTNIDTAIWARNVRRADCAVACVTAAWKF